MNEWTFLTHHAHVLLAVARERRRDRAGHRGDGGHLDPLLPPSSRSSAAPAPAHGAIKLDDSSALSS